MLLCIPVMLQLSPIKTLGESIFSKTAFIMNNNDKRNQNVPENDWTGLKLLLLSLVSLKYILGNKMIAAVHHFVYILIFPV